MSRWRYRFVTDTRRAVRLFKGLSLGTRLHLALRWWSCPIDAVAHEVPTHGDILEIGCGHGLVALHLATQSPHRRVLGVDIDDHKITVARRAAQQLRTHPANAIFDVIAAGAVPDGTWDAVVIVDVLYLLSAPDQHRLLQHASAALRPDGVLVIKEMGLTPRWKFRWNLIQETLATRALRITRTEQPRLTFTAPRDLAQWLAETELCVTTARVDRFYPWPHQLVVGRNFRSAARTQDADIPADRGLARPSS